jgi:PAS domain-containing protein
MIDDVVPSKVVLFPRDDLAFRAHVEFALARFPRDSKGLEDYLGAAYPEVRVRERTGLADLGGEHAWYVYRDGSVRAASDRDWWTNSELPEFRIDASGTYVGANAAAADLVGRAEAAIVGIRIGSFTRHEPVDDPGDHAFRVLAEMGSLESTAVVVRPDGEQVAVRYRLTGSPADGYRMVMARR